MVTENGRERMLTAQIVAEIFRISRARIYALAKGGILPCGRLARIILFFPQQIGRSSELEN